MPADPPSLSISATNPCHLWPMAVELAQLGRLGTYYSGYPAWKLNPPAGMALRTKPLRTLATYAALKFVPPHLRPHHSKLFRWQDDAFDCWVGAKLAPCGFFHAMPGQARDSLRAARRIGAKAVLNHATGPTQDLAEILRPEYERAGLTLEDETPYSAAYLAREADEYALADFHCAASTVVRDQLARRGVDPAKIWVVPYSADPAVFYPPEQPPRRDGGRFDLVFAGNLALRKGVRFLLAALEKVGRPEWTLHFYGHRLGETAIDVEAYRGPAKLAFHGPVPQAQLADAFRRAGALALPSLEDGFGLVVPQALACGLPCLVSDRTGAKDLVRHRENGSIFQTADAESLAEELRYWSESPQRAAPPPSWRECARQLIAATDAAAS